MRALLPLLLLVACSGDHMTPKAYELAAKWCEPHGGLVGAKVQVRSRDYWHLEASCLDQTSIAKTMQGVP